MGSWTVIAWYEGAVMEVWGNLDKQAMEAVFSRCRSHRSAVRVLAHLAG